MLSHAVLSTNGETNKRILRERNDIRLFVGNSLTKFLAIALHANPGEMILRIQRLMEEAMKRGKR